MTQELILKCMVTALSSEPVGQVHRSIHVMSHRCESKRRPMAMRMDGRWPLLEKRRILFSHRMNSIGHLQGVEALSVHAFSSAIARAQGPVTVLDIGANVGAFTLIAATLGARVVSVDMQPKCMDMVYCNVRANNLTAELHLAYVAPADVSQVIHVPDDDCAVMASRGAVAGRWPHGHLQRKSRIIYGIDNRTDLLGSRMRLVEVPPLHLGAQLASGLQQSPRASVIKIDTEGYEIAVLEALRPIWPQVDDVIMELQPNAWTHANVTLTQGIRTLQELMRSRRLTAVTMPHVGPEDTVSVIAGWSPCDVPSLLPSEPSSLFVPGKGVKSSRRFGLEGLEHYVMNAYAGPSKHGWFNEILLTSRCMHHAAP